MANQGRNGEVSEQLIGRLIPLLNPFWGMLPRRLWTATKDFFSYGTNWVVTDLAASAVEQPSDNDIQIQNDSHFMCIYLTQVVTAFDNEATFINPAPIEYRIQDSGSGRELTNQRLHSALWVGGTSQLPSYLPYPKLFKAASTVRWTATNLIATARHVRVAMVGFKIFDTSLEGLR